MDSHRNTVDSVEADGCAEGCAEIDLAAFAASDETTRKRVLLTQTARFASTFSRWLDANPCDGLTYLRFQVLQTLGHQGPIMMRDLAQRLGISARNATALIDALAEAGLVERRPHPTDRRATLVALTANGAGVASRESLQVETLGRLFDAFAPEDELQFLSRLTQLMQAMRGAALKR